MTTERTAEADDELADALRALGRRLDPEPDELARAAAAAYACRTAGADVAPLAYDSVLDDDLAAAGASPGPARRLTFVGRDLTVEVEVSEGRALTGRIVPPGPAEVEVRWPGGCAAAVTDILGRFRVPAVPPGPVSVRWEGPVVTEWISL